MAEQKTDKYPEAWVKRCPAPWIKGQTNVDVGGIHAPHHAIWGGQYRSRLVAIVFPAFELPASEANANFIAAAPLMLEALQKVEWVKVYHQGDFYLECPSCDEPKQTGHNDDCKIDAAIKAAIGQ